MCDPSAILFPYSSQVEQIDRRFLVWFVPLKELRVGQLYVFPDFVAALSVCPGGLVEKAMAQNHRHQLDAWNSN